MNDHPDDNLSKYFEDSHLKFGYVFPVPKSEDERVTTMCSAVSHYFVKEKIQAQVTRIDPKVNVQGYCQFSGGGDIRINTLQSILIVQGEIKGDDDEVSPIYDGTSVQSVSIEAKKGECDHEKLKNQLYANLMLGSVTEFVNRLPQYKEQDIQKVKKIVGYCIAYTGFGDVGFYKLIIEFGKRTAFITKVKLTRRLPTHAARLVDYFIQYYIRKHNQIASI